MNQMEAVAKLYGKKLGEEFTLFGYGIMNPHPYELKARFEMEGLMIEGKDYKAGDYYLADLLRGNAGIRED